MKKIYFIALLFVAIGCNSMAALSVYYNPDTQKIEYTAKGGLIFRLGIRAMQNGSPLILDINNTILIEDKATINRHIAFGAPDAEGWQLATWTTDLQAFGEVLNTEFVVTNNNEVGNRTIVFYMDDGLGMNIFKPSADNNGKLDLVTQLDFQDWSSVKTVYLVSTLSRQIYLDSISFSFQSNGSADSYGFHYNWLGNSSDRGGLNGNPPGKYIQPAIANQITIHYNHPPDNPYRREYMYLHFNTYTRKIPIVTSEEYNLQPITNIQLVSPKGKEVFFPCQNVSIEWKGQDQSREVIIDFSPDNGGLKWINIDTVEGTVNNYIWQVPNYATKYGLIRISQAYKRNYDKDRALVYSSDSIKGAAFNANSLKALTLSSSGNILEWDLYAASENQAVLITEEKGRPEYTYNDINYFLDDKKIVVLRQSLYTNDSELLFFNANGGGLIQTKELPDKFKAAKIVIGNESKFIAVVSPKYSNRIQFLDPNGDLINYYSDNAPITSFIINPADGNGYLSLLNNKIKIISLNDLHNIKLIKQYDFADSLNVINGVTVSKDTRLIGLTQKKANEAENATTFCNNFIYDNNTEVLFRNLNYSWQESIGLDFNPNGNIAIIGNETDPLLPWLDKLTLVDLTGKLNMDNMGIKTLFSNSLLGFELSKTGNALIAYSYDENINCKMIDFSLPEANQNEDLFTIENPQLNLTHQLHIDTLLIGTEREYTYESVLCNVGRVPAIFQSYHFENDLHFQFLENKLPDTINIGECKTIRLNAAPIDTGKITDNLIFTACEYDYAVPLSFYAKNRNLPAINPPVNFGELCSQEVKIMKIELFKNADTVDILVNKIAFADGIHFSIKNYPVDTILKPNEIYVCEIAFSPPEIGMFEDKLKIFHSNQEYVTPYYAVQGVGIGTVMSLSRNELYFIPEIRKRSLTLTNTGTATLYVDSVVFEPKGSYNITTQLPFYVNAGEHAEVEIEFIGDKPKTAQLDFIARPCVFIDSVKLGEYSAYVVLAMPIIYADPRDTNIVIPITYKQNENYPYNGLRYFEAEFEINPRIFYPTSVRSIYGAAKITSNKIVNDRRIFGVQIEGDFTDYMGTLLEINGIAGICEVENSTLNFMNKSSFYGAAVDVNYSNTTFNLINLCGDRRVLHGVQKMNINSFAPNPANDITNINYEILEDIDDEIMIGIYDLLGNQMISQKIENTRQGYYEQNINISLLSAGTYRVMLSYGMTSQVYTLQVVK